MSNRAEAMEEAMLKAIDDTEERHCVENESLERSTEDELRERVEEKKENAGVALEKQPLPFDKEEEEVKCNNSGALFVACSDEEKARTEQKSISALMKRHWADMRDAVDAAAKEARAVFTEAMNAAVEEALSKVRDESELRRRRDAEEAARVAKDNGSRRRAHEKEETSSSMQISVADKLLAAANNKADGEILRAVEEKIASMTAEKDR